ncbi:UDP-N-acetylglucosamine 2-epimerase (non-hydrolyzing) [Candidatus Dependentiae bacterium]|nr:UDP-N-acetylglucosamine 2-epimerase (non-hydrolyzing) [Candidatus Dependentiae bacterium]
MINPILLVIGTRAEAIKLIPLYLELKRSNIPVLLCATFQHFELLEEVFKIFDIIPDFNLKIMKKNQDLFYLQNTILEKTKEIYLKIKPSLILVHGDTTTTMASALSAFYLSIPIGHVEAGLRTGNMRSPFPEEMNRKVVGQIATYHFAPTAFSAANLLSEGVKRENVFCTGNTIVDALFFMRSKIETQTIKIDRKIVQLIEQYKKHKQKILLLTAHRRESFGAGLLRIFSAIKRFAQEKTDVIILYPYHPNPNVLKAIDESGIRLVKNVVLLEPLSYKNLVYVLINCDIIATDSGGIQEEAVSLGKRVLILRDITERWEGIWDGSEILVGTDENLILNSLYKFFSVSNLDIKPSMIYGDGNSCKRIVAILKTKLKLDDQNLISYKYAKDMKAIFQ